jgi:DNA-directed RNA polymerase subunit F
MNLRPIGLSRLVAMFCLVAAGAGAGDVFEQPPINYSATRPNDAVTRLQTRLATGALKLAGNEREILAGVLRELNVPVESQVLVFSKTSLQHQRISPDRPRAIYFSDTCYVGWLPSGLMEIAALDPVLGPVFYKADFNAAGTGAPPKIARDNDCLRCHGGTFVRDIPGLLVRSLHTDAAGEMLLQGGSELVDYRTPFTNRWGGWYVTGRHGTTLHRGNVFTQVKDGQLVADFQRGANVTSLEDFFDASRYLTNSSDIVALLVLEHQTAMQNQITRAGMVCRRMLEYQQTLQRELKETSTNDLAYDSVRSVFNSAVQDLVDDLLFYKEAALPAGLAGDAAFQKAFQRDAVRTRAGRSLKDFSLAGHLFQNRCSHLIYSETFLALPPQLKRRVYERLSQVLQSAESHPRYAYLDKEERARIVDILRETHPELRRVLTDDNAARRN